LGPVKPCLLIFEQANGCFEAKYEMESLSSFYYGQPMSFSVDKVAALAYLKLSEAEKKTFEAQFKDILGYVDQLQKIPMTADEAKSMGAFHIQQKFYEILGLNFASTLREDSSDTDAESLLFTNADATRSAPKADGLPGELLYEVPSIIDR